MITPNKQEIGRMLATKSGRAALAELMVPAILESFANHEREAHRHGMTLPEYLEEWDKTGGPLKDAPLSADEIAGAEQRADELLRMDVEWGWKEMINIVGYSVVEDGVKMIPKLVKHIRELEKRIEGLEGQQAM